MSEQLQQNLLKLKTLENEYFKTFSKFYPTYYNHNDGEVFGPNELYEMAIEAEVLLSSLGQTAVKRLQYLGFDLLFPFNNPVDWYNWHIVIKERKIDQTVYFSISIRVATEFKRMEQHLELGTWDSYCALNASDFSVSKERYAGLFEDKSQKKAAEDEAVPVVKNVQQHINISEFEYNENVEQQAVNNLDKMHKQTGVWSNVANVVSAAMKAAGVKL